MQNQLQRVINLVRKTGDKLVVFDSAKTEDTCVVLTLKDYENLILGKSEVKNLTEDELLDKINRDIAIWKSDQEFDQEFEKIDKIKISSLLNKPLNKFENYKEDDDCCFSQDNQYDDKKSGRGWSIPSTRKQYKEEIIDEDRQYLEEVLF
ncbi:MAG: hypothetical protein ABH818_02840 [Patescibacteria group bacterium]|nr:hypothetical protein [Patescibacteria group bacterium]MBU1870626.1 hypothetical protein [Patescibacteria group bacterium]